MSDSVPTPPRSAAELAADSTTPSAAPQTAKPVTQQQVQAEPQETSQDSLQPPVDPRLLEVLVCPLTKHPLEYDRSSNELISRQAGLAFPIRDGIPIMLPEEARKLEE